MITAMVTKRAASILNFKATYARVFRTIWLLTAFSLPLSVKLYFPVIDLEVVFPAEPMLALLFLMFIAALAIKFLRPSFVKGFFLAPITMIVVVLLCCSVLSLVFSAMPLVSAKAVLVQVVFLGVFYFSTASSLFPDRRTAWMKAFNLYGATFVIVAFYALTVQATEGFDRAGSNRTAYPFFIDHTIYAAALTFVLFICAYRAVSSFRHQSASGERTSLVLLALFCLFAFFLSYCRAAWLALAIVLLFVPVLVFRSWRASLLTCFVTGALIVFMAHGQVRSGLPNASEQGAGIRETLLSMANTRTDPSNAERLYRWHGAWRMFKEKPLTGFGPGTFQFEYRAFQPPVEIITLSMAGPAHPDRITREWGIGNEVMVRSNPQFMFQSGGTAHSEYLLALAESGIPYALAFLSLLAVAISMGFRFVLGQARNGRGPVLMALLGLGAYAVHGVFNNYLDDPKVAFLFWGCIAIIAAHAHD